MNDFRRRQMMAVSVKRQIIWNQLVVNGNFAEGGDDPTGWTKGYDSIIDNSNSDYVIVEGRNFAYQEPQNPFTVGHIYYVKFKARYGNSNTSGYIYCSWYTSNIIKPNLDGSWTEFTLYGPAKNNATFSTYGLFRVYIGSPAGCILQFDKNYGINIFDLTMMFGAGNEPTQAKFESMFNLPNTYYPYNAGEVMYI